MAIIKGVENEFGIEFNYHKLREVRLVNDGDSVQLVLTVYSWIDKQARIDGKQPCMRQCIINGADFALNPFYALLKAKFKEFTNGENDFDDAFKGERQPVAPEIYDQTMQGQLFKSWKEVPEGQEPESETPAEPVEEQTEAADENQPEEEQLAEETEETIEEAGEPAVETEEPSETDEEKAEGVEE